MAEQFLQQHMGSKLKLVALYVDLVDSTLMTRDFSVEKLDYNNTDVYTRNVGCRLQF